MSAREPELIDTAAAARMLRVKRTTIWRYIKSGRLVPDAHFARSPAFRPATIRAYVDGMSQSGRTEYLRRVAEERQGRD